MQIVGIIIFLLTALAYEAIRVNGEYSFWVTRHGKENTHFDLLVDNWQPIYLAVYLCIWFSTHLVIFMNSTRPKIQWLWVGFSLIMLSWLVHSIPNASEGRHSSTCMFFSLIYCFALPIPAMLLIFLGGREKYSSEPFCGNTPQGKPVKSEKVNNDMLENEIVRDKQ